MAHVNDLADPFYEGDEASPEQWASLAAALDAANVNADFLRVRITPDNTIPAGEVADAAAGLLGSVVGACFGRMPNLRMLMVADRLVWSKVGWTAFSAAIVDEVCVNDCRMIELERCLVDLVHAFTCAPRTIVDAFRNDTCALAERYHLQPRLDDVWSSNHFSIILVKYKPAFDALRLLDDARYLRMLDTFPHPEPARHVIEYAAGLMDLDGLLGLLAVACPCFESGRWLPWIKTPFLILTSLEAKLETMAESDVGAASENFAAFADAVDKTVKGVQRRADGNELGYAWLQKLMQQNTFGKRRRLEQERSDSERYDLLLLTLASVLSPRCCVVDWVRDEQETLRRYRAVAAIAAIGLGETRLIEATSALIENVLPLGLWATAQDHSFLMSSSSERRLMAFVIGGHDAPAVWFECLWRNLAPIRDRARHVAAQAGGHAGDATVIVVTWFLFGLDAIDERTTAHRALWLSLHSAIHECAMVQTSPIAQSAWRARYKFLAAHLARRLTNVGDEAAMLDLRTLLGPLLCLDMTLAEVVDVLFGADVVPAVVAAGSERAALLIELLRRLQIEQLWREAKQRGQIGNRPNFSQKIADMANAIAASVSSPM